MADATEPKTYPGGPIDLPVGFEHWLLDCVPNPNCDVCAADWKQLQEAKDVGDITRAARHATEIRDHASGIHD